jgi:hypothetical protein
MCVCVGVQVLFFFGSRYAHIVEHHAVRVAGWVSSVCGYKDGTSGCDIGGWK